jgi:ABC-2 type transport system ATP-binding protein
VPGQLAHILCQARTLGCLSAHRGFLLTDPTEHAQPETLVVLQDFTVRYGRFTAVDRVSFSVPPGACGLLGKNGAGKSSVLKAVLGLLKPSSGTARVLGLDAARDGLRLRDLVGYMPEREAAFPGLSGLESAVLAAQLSGLPGREARQRAHEVLFLVGCGEERYRPVGGYSTGMKQRVKLAMALVHDPVLLFLDEPTNGLDPGGRSEILALLGDLVDKGKSLILSSHILSDVESLCEHVVLIDGGRILAQEPLETFTASAGSFFRVGVHGNVHRFEAKMRELGRLETDLGKGQYLVQADGAAGALFEIAFCCEVQIRFLEKDRRSLTDVFLSKVGKTQGSPEAVAGAASPGEATQGGRD